MAGTGRIRWGRLDGSERPRGVGGSGRKGLKGKRLVVTWVCSVIFIRHCLLGEERRGRKEGKGGKKEREGRYGELCRGGGDDDDGDLTNHR